MKSKNSDYNRILNRQLREEMKALILAEFDGQSFRRGNLYEKYQKTLEAKNLPVPGWRKFNNMFYTVSKNLRYAGLLKSLGSGTYYANAAETRDEESEEEFVGTVEDGDIIEDEEPEMSLTKIVGTGQSEVYVYYYPAYRELAKKTVKNSIGVRLEGLQRVLKAVWAALSAQMLQKGELWQFVSGLIFQRKLRNIFMLQ